MPCAHIAALARKRCPQPGALAVPAHIGRRTVRKVCNALVDLGATDFQKRGRWPWILPPGQLRDHSSFCRLECNQIDLDLGDVFRQVAPHRIVERKLGAGDALEVLQAALRAAGARHAGALVAEQELGVGPTLVFLANQIGDRHANIFEENVIDLVAADDREYNWPHGLDSRAKCNGAMRTGFARLCQAL